MSISCFMMNPSKVVYRYLRRYSAGDERCSEKASYHNATKLIEILEIPEPAGIFEQDERMSSGDLHPHNDVRFPTKCDNCDYIFIPEDYFQVSTERMWQRENTHGLYRISEFPTGAMYYADWMLIENSNFYRGDDNHCLVVITPDGFPWFIDGAANNCTRPTENHKCWCRKGIPPNITVSKQGCETCAAGAGSIQTSKWHGFLRNGELTET